RRRRQSQCGSFRSCCSYRGGRKADQAIVFESGQARGEKRVRKVAVVRGVDANIVPGQAPPGAAALVLPEDVHRAAEEAPAEGERSLTASLKQPLEAGTAHLRRQVARHERSSSVRPPGIGEGVDGRKTDLPAGADGRLEVGV